MRDGRYLPIISSNGSKLNISKKARRGKVSVPAPAVIPALLAYIEVDAVKKLVVGDVGVREKLFGVRKDVQATCSIYF